MPNRPEADTQFAQTIVINPQKVGLEGFEPPTKGL